jgi:hypothetical protein
MPTTDFAKAESPKEEKKLLKVNKALSNYDQSRSSWASGKGNIRKLVKARKKVSKYLRNK